jgi:Condensation domain
MFHRRLARDFVGIELPVTAVEFTDAGDGEAPLMWAQSAMWRAIVATDNDPALNQADIWPVPPGTSVGTLIGVWRTLVTRHESLRTTYRVRDDGSVVQSVHGAGTIAVDVVDVPADIAVADAYRLVTDLKARRFDLATELPVRLCFLRMGSDVPFVGFSLSHMAVDGWSAELLRNEFAALLRGDELAPTGQPRDRVAFESSAAGLRVQEKSLDYWQSCVDRTPEVLIRSWDGPPEPWIEYTLISSPALAESAQAVAHRERVAPAAVVQAAVTLAMAVAADAPSTFLRILATTRFRAESRHLVGAFNQEAPLYVARTDATFGEYVGRCAFAALRAYRSSECAPDLLTARVEGALARRGIEHGGRCYYNDLRFVQRDVLASLRRWPGVIAESTAARATVYELTPTVQSGMFFLTVHGLDKTGDLTLSKDSRFLPGISATAFLLGVGRVLDLAADERLDNVAALTRGDLFIR